MMKSQCGIQVSVMVNPYNYWELMTVESVLLRLTWVLFRPNIVLLFSSNLDCHFVIFTISCFNEPENMASWVSYLFCSPALQAYSHSASVGNLLPPHWQNATASFHEMWIAGWSILQSTKVKQTEVLFDYWYIIIWRPNYEIAVQPRHEPHAREWPRAWWQSHSRVHVTRTRQELTKSECWRPLHHHFGARSCTCMWRWDEVKWHINPSVHVPEVTGWVCKSNPKKSDERHWCWPKHYCLHFLGTKIYKKGKSTGQVWMFQMVHRR